MKVKSHQIPTSIDATAVRWDIDDCIIYLRRADGKWSGERCLDFDADEWQELPEDYVHDIRQLHQLIVPQAQC
jgi:hypothetical protein